MTRKALRTRLCEMLGIEYPILLAGMGVLGMATPPRLVAAVSNAGGMGFAACSQNSPEWVRRTVREIKQLTEKPFGVNVMFPSTGAENLGTPEEIYQKLQKEYPEHVAFVRNLMQELGLPLYDFKDWDAEFRGTYSRENAWQQLEIVLEEKVPVISCGLGLPPEVAQVAHENGMKVLATAGSARNAVRHAEAGADIIVAQGHEAGGHTGRISTIPLVLSAIEAIKPVPVVAAGGIVNGRALAAALALGAIGVWCGTAFLLSEECNIYPEHKEKIIRGRAEEWTVSRCYTGKTARHYRNKVIETWEKSGLPVLPMAYETVLFNMLQSSAARHHKPEYIYNAASQSINLLKEIRPARQIIAEMVNEALDTLKKLNGLLPEN
ncbi:NAD(P)H-dependent flavin oxidoreductase [Chloroflexota bacterium]